MSSGFIFIIRGMYKDLSICSVALNYTTISSISFLSNGCGAPWVGVWGLGAGSTASFYDTKVRRIKRTRVQG